MLRKTARTAALLTLLSAPIACDSGTEPGPAPAAIELASRVDILPTGQTFPLEVLVKDADGNPITNANVEYSSSNDAIGTVNGSGVLTGMGEGEVTITATAGPVSDQVSLFIVHFNDPCVEALAIDPGESIRASLQAGDCDEILDDGSYVDLWYFDLAQRSAVTIDLSSDDFNAYLWLDRLENETLVPVAEDDNSGPGTDARIEATLDPGTYFILANNYPEADGVYTLSVTTAAAADPALRAWTQNRVRTVPPERLRNR